MPYLRDDEKLSRTENYPQLLSLAVHELRGPASIINGYLRMLQRDNDPPLSERQLKMVEEAVKSCARMVAMVAEMSEIGKLDSGQLAVARQPLDLFTIVSEVADLVHEPNDREVHLKAAGRDHGASIVGDAPRLRTAFDALFRAILREKPGPTTVLADRRVVSRDGQTCAVVVISEEASVQDAYEREAGPFNEKIGGVGLALPLARRVIERHGGRVWSPKSIVENDPLTRGSAIVSLPITE